MKHSRFWKGSVLSYMNMLDTKKIEKIIGYRFQNEALLKTAMTHSSYANEHRNQNICDNERMEYLGDAVLELVVSEFLYHTRPDMAEGNMTKVRASIVCEPTLYLCAKNISLGNCILLGKGEDSTGGRNRPSIVSDAMEALIGAIYLDGGFADAKEFIHRFILDDIDHLQLFFDSKTILQEIVQRDMPGELVYVPVEEKGPDHNKTFVVNVVLDGRVLGNGSGHTKKAAEQEAAYRAILSLQGEKEI